MQGNRNKLLLTTIHIKHFRCFTSATIDFESPIALIQGNNGSGKTSLLEALHYVCYLRSFRTHSPRDMVHVGQEGFFIKASFDQELDQQRITHHVQVGFAGKKRLVKMNEQTVSSYKELIDHYRIVTLTEDDLQLISQGPELRRAFIDQGILLHHPEFITTLKMHKQVVENRNKLLLTNTRDTDSLAVWSQQLWHTACAIQNQRTLFLATLSSLVNELLEEFFKEEELSIAFTYQAKNMGHATWQEFQHEKSELHGQEIRFGRSLFGAHLDDFAIQFQNRKSKTFASRGQQKLIVMLIKIAQIKHVMALKGPAVFLLDDFMTDFDAERAQKLLTIVTNLDCQLIFTSPLTKNGPFEQQLIEQGGRSILLTH